MTRFRRLLSLTLACAPLASWGGGINVPQPVPKPLPGVGRATLDSSAALRLTQTYTRDVARAASSFWAAHEALEEAVLAESSGNEVGSPDRCVGFLTRAAAHMQASASAFHDAAALAREGADLGIRFRGFREHFGKQAVRWDELATLTLGVSELLSQASMTQACTRASLQESMCHDGDNATVRIESIEIIGVLDTAISAHVQWVIEANARD